MTANAGTPRYPGEAAWFVYVAGRWSMPLSTAARNRFDNYDDYHPLDRAQLERQLLEDLPQWADVTERGRPSSISFEAGTPIPAWLVTELSWNVDYRRLVPLTATGERIDIGGCEFSAGENMVEGAQSLLHECTGDEMAPDDPSSVETEKTRGSIRRRGFLASAGASATATMVGRAEGQTQADDETILEVQVLSQGGNPLPNATVTVDGETAETNSEGIVTFDLETGSYIVEATAPAYRGRETEVTVDGSESLRLTLERDYTGIEIINYNIGITRRADADDTIDATVTIENRNTHDSESMWVDVYVYDDTSEELGVEISKNVSLAPGDREELEIVVARSDGESFPPDLAIGSSVIRLDSLESSGYIDEVRTGDAPVEPERRTVAEEPTPVDNGTTINLDREYTPINIVDATVDITRRDDAEDTIDAEITVENRGSQESGNMWLDVYVYDDAGDEIGTETSRVISVPSGGSEEVRVIVARSDFESFNEGLTIASSVVRLESIESPDRIDEVRTGNPPAEPNQIVVDEEPVRADVNETTLNLDREYESIRIVDHSMTITRRDDAEDTIDAEITVENRGSQESGNMWLDVYAYDIDGELHGDESSRIFSVEPGSREELRVLVTRSERENFPADLAIGSYELVLDSIESPNRIDETSGRSTA